MFTNLSRILNATAFVYIYMCKPCNKLHVITDIISPNKLKEVLGNCSDLCIYMQNELSSNPEDFIKKLKEDMKHLGLDIEYIN